MTTPNCASWMQSQDHQDPCTTAQEVGQLCNPNYVVSSINFQESQYVPNATTANGCTCSWSIYNLLSACASCVGISQLTSWNNWTASCEGYLSNNSYLPSSLSLSQGSIPYWAITNPTTWYGGVFNVTQASGIAAADKPDVSGAPIPTSSAPPPSTSSSSTIPVGAIVGGVIGGILLIVISGTFIFCLLRRRRRRRRHRDQQPITDTSGIYVGITTPATVGGLRRPTSSMILSPSMISLTSPAILIGGHSSNLNNRQGDPAASPFDSHAQPNVTITSTRPAAGARTASTQPTQKRARLNPPPYSTSTSPAPASSCDTPGPPMWKRVVSGKR